MVELVTLRTKRLLLRPWSNADREPFAKLNADPIVMEHFPDTLNRGESDAMVDRIQCGFAERGWGLWAVEMLGGLDGNQQAVCSQPDADEPCGFIGYVGLAIPRFKAHFTPCVEVGWRLERRAWGHGFATEGALASLEFGFKNLGLGLIVSFTAVSNTRSQRVMRRLGMVNNPSDDFDHPLVPEGQRLRRHVLFRLNSGDFKGDTRSGDAL